MLEIVLCILRVRAVAWESGILGLSLVLPLPGWVTRADVAPICRMQGGDGSA